MNEKLAGEVTALKAAVEAEKLKAERFWRLRCEQMLQEEDQLQAKDAEIMHLRKQLSKANVPTNPVDVESVAGTSMRTTTATDVISGDRSG